MALAGMQAKVALEHRRAQQEAEGEEAARDEGEGALDLLSDASMSKVGADRIARARMASEARSGEAPSRVPSAPLRTASALASPGGGELPKAVLSDIRALYQKRIQRKSHYLELFAFLLYSCMYLAILFLQRQAYSAYEVNFTMVNNFVPSDGDEPAQAMGGQEDIYLWLQGLLDNTWSDPVCGDGTCEFPYEFPSYGRFGCQADCGRLATTEPDAAQLRIEIYADFTHYSSSLSATELMVKSSWNLCPVPGTAAHGLDCWFDADQKFSDTRVDRTGANAITLNDVVPDGFARDGDPTGTGWELRVKGDIFHKVRGRVLDQKNYLLREAVASKRESAAQQEQRWVEQLAWFDDARDFFLQENLTDDTLHSVNETYYDDLNQLKRAAPFAIKAAAVRIQNEVIQEDQDATIESILSFTAGRRAEAETRIAREREDSASPRQCGIGNVVCTHKFLVDVQKLVPGRLPSVVDCDSGLYNCTEWDISVFPEEIVYVDSVPYPADNRTDLEAFLLATGQSELEVINSPQNWRGGRTEYLECDICSRASAGEDDEICRCQRGGMIPSNFCNCSADILQPHCMEYISTLDGYNTETARRRLLTGEVLSYTAAYEPLSAFSAAARQLLDAGASSGERRMAQYETLDALDDVLSAVTPLVAVEQGQGRRMLSVGGVGSVTMASATRAAEARGLDGARASMVGEVVAGAHGVVIDDALVAHDTLRAALRRLASAGAEVPQARRALQQAGDVDDVLLALSGVSDQTDILRKELDGLQREVVAAKTVAEEAAADDTLLKTLNAGFSEIAEGQEVLTNLLNEVLGKQSEAAAVAQAAAAAQAEVAALKGAAASRELSVIAEAESKKAQFDAYLESGNILTPEQHEVIVKELYARKWMELRKINLAAKPCSTTTRAFRFSLDKYISQRNYQRSDRVRKIGSTNRVVAGLLLHLTRYDTSECSSDSFANIVDTCLSGLTREPYGTDPMFKRGTNLYNAELENDKSKALYYNCSFQAQLDDVSPDSEFYQLYTANLTVGGESYREPFCPALYNTKELPYAFHYMPMEGFEDGYPVFFDINLSEEGVMKYFTYVLEALYLDDLARGLTVQLVTYNGELEYFANSRVTFSFKEGGTISVNYNVQTVKVTLYEDTEDWVRFGLEVMLALGVLIAAFFECKEAFTTWRETGSLMVHFSSVWNYIDALSIGLQIAALVIWWDFVLTKANTFECDLRYDVYKDLSSPARLLQNNYDTDGGIFSLVPDSYGADLDRLAAMYGAINDMTNQQILYMTLNGINIMLTLLRILKLMDFQPRLGVVTRSLGLAASDLGHFFILAMIIFLGYSMMAHLIFGYSIKNFSTLGLAINTCFEILLGEISVNAELMRLNSLEKIPAVIFFWSYEILVFMILLNFLLAIIVDAFSDVKSQIEETRGLPEEVATYVGEGMSSMLQTLNLGAKDYVSDEAIAKQLDQWADEEEQQEEKEDAERVLNVGDEALSAEQIAVLLRAASVAGDGDEHALEGKELDRVVAAIMERFGEELDADDAERQERKAEKQRSREALVDNLAAVLDGQEKILKKLAEGQKIQKQKERR